MPLIPAPDCGDWRGDLDGAVRGPRFEAFDVRAADDLSWAGDTVNQV
jgi:hypothetical protein